MCAQYQKTQNQNKNITTNALKSTTQNFTTIFTHLLSTNINIFLLIADKLKTFIFKNTNTSNVASTTTTKHKRSSTNY